MAILSCDQAHAVVARLAEVEAERDRLLLVLTRVEQRLTFRGPPYDLLGDVRAALAEPTGDTP